MTNITILELHQSPWTNRNQHYSWQLSQITCTQQIAAIELTTVHSSAGYHDYGFRIKVPTEW